MNVQARRDRLRAVLAGARCIYPASVYDPLSGRIAGELGFEAGMLGGSMAVIECLGAPELPLATLSELCEQAYRIGRACELPLMVDADDGFGNALNVMRSVEELERAGISALTIEDTVQPQPFGNERPPLIPVEEAVAKLRAAIRARRDPRLIVVARSQSIRYGGTQEAIARGRAYQETGVDALWFPRVQSRAQLAEMAAAFSLPLMIGGVGPELLDLDFLSAHNVRVCLQGHLSIRAAAWAVRETLKALREGVAPADIPNLASREDMGRLTRHREYEQWTREFLES